MFSYIPNLAAIFAIINSRYLLKSFNIDYIMDNLTKLSAVMCGFQSRKLSHPISRISSYIQTDGYMKIHCDMVTMVTDKDDI